MRVAVVIVAAGIATICWLRNSKRVDDTPRWKPEDRPINDNRDRERR